MALASGSLRLPWQASGWSEVLIDQDGRIGPPTHHSYLLLAVTALLAATLVVACFDVMRPAAASGTAGLTGVATAAGGGAPAPPAAPAADDLSAEMLRVLQHLRSFLDANSLHSAALAKVNSQLPGIGSPEQIRMVVSYLVMENENMRGRTRELSSSLESSKRQIENLKGNLAQAKAEGLIDSLTHLKNRRAFDLALAGEAAAARKSNRPMCVVMGDVDRFKSVNDRFGHPAGDELLRWLGRMFSTSVKGRDTAARYGGEEFGVILPQTALADAATVANQIRHQIEATPWTVPDEAGTRLNVTISFGVGELRSGETTDALLRRVDTKLYEAKQAGRNCVVA
jgi:diguanylate cyclase